MELMSSGRPVKSQILLDPELIIRESSLPGPDSTIRYSAKRR
jgi:hypothetical protein